MESEEQKTWNQQFAEWCRNSGKNLMQISQEIGIPYNTLFNYKNADVKNVDKISPGRRDILYKTTGLECFKCTQRIEILEPKKYKEPTHVRKLKSIGSEILDAARKGKESIDRVVEEAISKIPGREKLEAGLLKAQRYNPDAKQRADAIMEILDILAEEVDYFRTAHNGDKGILIERLKKEPESFGYVSQMLNILYKGEGVDKWMLMAQPPSKIKRVIRGESK